MNLYCERERKEREREREREREMEGDEGVEAKVEGMKWDKGNV